MHRTSILLPDDLRTAAESVAKRRGITLSELIRRQLALTVRGSKLSDRESDAVFRPAKLMRAGGSGDMSARHDEYLYGPARRGSAK